MMRTTGECLFKTALLAVYVACIASPLPSAFGGQTVVVVLDDSGSMDKPMQPRQRKIAAAKQALASVLKSVPHDTQVGILTLNSTAGGSHWIVPIGSPEPTRWEMALNGIRAKGGTPLGQFMREAADELLKRRSQDPFSTYRLLVVTDGEATDGPLLASIMPDLLSRGINLDVIGVDMQEQHSLARSAHSYRQAGDQAALAQALTEVFAETARDDPSAAADFELLAGLPEEVAREVVKGLTTARNDPLLTASSSGVDAPAQPGVPPAPTPLGNSSPQPAQPGTSGSAISILFSTLCCLGTFTLVGLVILSIVVGAIKKNTRS